jgi:hypothetical protein
MQFFARFRGSPKRDGERPSTTTGKAPAQVEPHKGQLIIFLSAVSDEFGGYRARLRDDLMRAAEVGAAIQEDFGAIGTGTLEGLDARIRDCTAVVHLIGEMSGACPPRSAVRRLLDLCPGMSERLGLDRNTLLARQKAISRARGGVRCAARV